LFVVFLQSKEAAKAAADKEASLSVTIASETDRADTLASKLADLELAHRQTIVREAGFFL
jgi:hypothetical protein